MQVKFKLCRRKKIPTLNAIMQGPVMPRSSLAPASARKPLALVHVISIFLLGAAYVFTLAAVIGKSDTDLPEAFLLLLAAFSTLTALARRLPAQNVLLAAFLTALIGSAAHFCGVKTGIPFGLFMFGPAAGAKFAGPLPWIMPLFWVVAVLNSRGVARLVLRPWRKMRTYGFWLMGLTAMFTMLFDCALEPFATHGKHYWIWMSTGLTVTSQGSPVSNLVGWFIVTLLILAFTTPVLINKQLSKRSAPDLHPLVVWLGAILLFGIAAAVHGFQVAAAIDAVIGLATAAFAIRGARW
jgi:uncharacterized membrane protein